MIVKRLIELQKQRELTNQEFARSLNIHVRSWRRNKSTGIISPTVLLRSFEVYPEIKDDFFADIIAVPSDKPPKRNLGVLKRFFVSLYTKVRDAEYLKEH